MFFKKKPKTEDKGYTYKPRQFDRDEKIAIQKIVSSIPVTRKLLSQDLLVTAINNFVVKNIKSAQPPPTILIQQSTRSCFFNPSEI